MGSRTAAVNCDERSADLAPPLAGRSAIDEGCG